MKYGNKKLLLPFFLFLLAFVLFSFKAFAQNQSSYDVTVSPVFFDLSSKPGGSISDKIRIRNNSSSPIPIVMQVEKITGDLNGNITLLPDTTDQTLSWVSFKSDKVILPPLEWTDVPFTIQIPQDAGYGYYLAISFKQDNSNPLAKTGASITGAASVPILLNVIKPGAKATGNILEFSTKNYVYEYLPVDFTVRVGNTGNIHIKPHGSIFITSGDNKNPAILDVNSGLANVIPGTARIFNASWDDGFIVNEPVMEAGQPKLDKNGKPEMHLAINWDKLTSFRFGKYDANLLLVFDNGTRDVPLQASLSFWVIPYELIGGIILAIIILILLIRYALKSYVKRELKLREKEEKTL